MDTVFKTCFFDASGNVSHIYVFCGEEEKSPQEFFSRSEYNELVHRQIPIHCSSLYIHPDDSIYDIKRKILLTTFEKEANDEPDIPSAFSYEEMYLYGVVERDFNLLQYYKNVTENDELGLNLSLLGQSLVNYQIDENSISEDILTLYGINDIHKVLQYEDLMKIPFFNTDTNTKLQKIPLGYRFYKTNNDQTHLQNVNEAFVVNPYDLWKNASIVNKKPFQNFENDFLFHFGSLQHNTIYVTLAEHVLEFAKENILDEEGLCSMYFPELTKKNIQSKQSLLVAKQSFVTESRKKYYDVNVKYSFQKLSLFHDIFEMNKTKELPYLERGIQSFFITLHPESKTQKIPIENIFKNIHANSQIPFIQYNPGTRQENTYRVFYKDIAKNGKKIPYLPKIIFSQFMRKMSRTESVCMFIDQLYMNAKRNDFHVNDFIQMIFQSNGDIQIKGVLLKPLMPVEFNSWLIKLCEPALVMINNFLQQSGYFISFFKSIYDSFVEVIDLNFVCKINMDDLSLKKYMGCFSSLFYHEIKTLKNKGLHMRYKRVENFRKMSAEDEFIAALLRVNQDKKYIASQIKQAFPDKDPKTIMQDYEERHMNYLIPGRFINKRIEVMENAGFVTLFKRIGNTYNIEVSGINLSQYLYVIPIYLDSLIRININPEVLTPDMVKLCNISNATVIEDSQLNKGMQLNTMKPIVFVDEQQKEPKLLRDENDMDEAEKEEDIEDDYGLDLYDEDEEENPEEKGDEKANDQDDVDDEEPNVDQEQVEEEEEEEEENKDENKEEEEESEQEQNPDIDNGKEAVEEKESDDDYDLDMYDESNETDKDENEDNDNKKKVGGVNNDDDDDDDNIQNNGKETINNYWRKKMKEHDPILFKILNKGFTRLNQQEQPVILTQDEIKKIDPTKYTNALKYRKDKKGNPLYYICPRYWCTKPSMEGPISEQDAKSGKCGKIMNTEKDRMKKETIGEYVIEYSGQNPEPGFVNSSKHKLTDDQGNRVCGPKCFKKWDTKVQKDSRMLCSAEYYAEQNPKKKKQIKNIRPTDTYILESNSFPLPFGRVGKLPIPIQTFLNTNNEICIKDKKIKANCPVLLRYGPESTQLGNQSFLACLCDIYSFENNKTNAPYTLSQFKKILTDSISFDVYITLHNGSIASIFQQADSNINDVDISPYKNTFLYSKLNTYDESQMSFFKHSILSYEKFKDFIHNDTVVIDHTYLWEVMSRPNKLLFKNGLNLAILEMPEHDNTNNVILICPTNPYTYPIYDSNRKTVLLVRQTNENGTYYESIYRYKRNYRVEDGEKIETEDIKKQFSNKSSDIKGLGNIMQLIRNVMYAKCKPKQPQIYDFQHNKTVSEILTILRIHSGLAVHSRVLNFQGKTIGLLVDWKNKPTEVISTKPFYLPCYPSTIDDESLKVLWMDDETLWTDYYSTVSFLRHIFAISDKQIQCDPKFRIISNNKIAGILTNTNQFVQIDKPIENITIGDGLKPIHGSNYIISDKKIQTKTQPKTEEITTPIQNKESHFMHLEAQFYLVFRSTIRIVLNIYRNRFKYKEILAIHENEKMLYREKRKQVVEILKTLAKDNIRFQRYTESVLLSIYDIYNCETNCKDKKYCFYEEQNGQCVMLIPDKHLVSGKSNESIYFMRLADELLRHKRVHLFMFYPDSYLNIINTDMKIDDHEFVMTDFEFKNDYFKDIEPYTSSEFARKTTYETAVPITKPYPIKVDWIKEYEQADLDLRKM